MDDLAVVANSVPAWLGYTAVADVWSDGFLGVGEGVST